MDLELNRVRVFDVLRNALNGELAVVLKVSGNLLDLRDKTGAVVRYKFGKHFSRAPEDEAIAFRTAVRALRKQQQETGKKKRPRTAAGFLRRLAKKR